MRTMIWASAIFAALTASVTQADVSGALPPHGRLMPLDLRQVDESAWELPGRRFSIHAMADATHPWSPQKQPLILMLGIGSVATQYRDIVERFKDSPRYQLYFCAYDGWHRRATENGEDLARELRHFKGKPVTLIVHSLGGIIARHAINQLHVTGDVGLFPSVDMHAIDVPWHGYFGPNDETKDPGLFKRISFALMPDGMIDMRAGSWLFHSPRAPLFTSRLARHVHIHIVFSKTGRTAVDHNKSRKLRPLPSLLVQWMNGGPEPGVGKSIELRNYWTALQTSSGYAYLMRFLNAAKAQGALTPALALHALNETFPTFPGDHVTVLYEQSAGERSFLDALTLELNK